MKVIAELSITPLGVGLSLTKYIVECQRILKIKKLSFQIHAEGTNIEGDLNEVMDAIKICIEKLHEIGVPRMMTHIMISSRTDKTESMQEKIDRVEKN